MKILTPLFIFLFCLTAQAQIELVASSSENPKGFPVAYFVDKKSISFTKDTIKFSGFMTGIKPYKDNFEIDTSSYLIYSEVEADCKAFTFRETKRLGTDDGLFSVTWDKNPSIEAKKGSVIFITLTKLCKERSLKA